MGIKNITSRIEMWNMWEEVHSLKPDSALSIHDFVNDSWERSKSYNVDPYKHLNTAVLSQGQLEQRIRENRDLLDMVVPTMEDIYNITRDSGFCIALADKDGVLLKMIGSPRELRFTSVGNFIEGAIWSEEIMGTNAVGTVLAIDEPIHIFGYEHYCKCACLSTCSAAPIHDEDGNILGVLDLTGPYKNVHPHTLGMVMSAVRAIERKMLLNKAYNEVKLASMTKEAIMESILEGLIAIDRNGEIIQMNKQAGDILGIPPNKAVNNFMDFVPRSNTYVREILTSDRSIYGENVSLNTFAGKTKKFIMNVTPLKKDERTDGYVIVLHEMHNVLRNIIRPKNIITFDTLIGESKNYIMAVEQAKMASQSNSTILLMGESGVGKDLFAQAIHNNGYRRKETFFALNCGALPRELISSELFGYEEGAFTGARKGGNPGKFELADKGTLFLDEIGEMPLDLQASLLRVLEERTVIRLGGREFIPVDVRIICATNKDLVEEMKNHNFRQDLYFRVGVISIHIPPLRERKDDIPLLAEYFISSMGEKFDKSIKRIDPEVMDIFINHTWPGNIRELSNVIERAINMAQGNSITIDLLPPAITESVSSENISVWENSPTKDSVEEQLIRSYLIKFNNNKTEVAKALNISRSCLYRRMSRYDINV
jgi:PAS domain S-box-containing protein